MRPWKNIFSDWNGGLGQAAEVRSKDKEVNRDHAILPAAGGFRLNFTETKIESMLFRLMLAE